MIQRSLLLASAFYVITFGQTHAQDTPPLRVVATFSIIADFASEVGGERIELTTLVGPDGDAHVYEPRPADAIALARADVVLANGLLFEGFMTRLIAASGTAAPVAELTEGATILEDPMGGHTHASAGGGSTFHAAPFDPHAWQSVANARTYVANVAAAFCAADEAGCDTYRVNAERYSAELDALDRELREAVDSIPAERRVAVVAHNSFRYLGEAYGIAFLSPQGVSTESEASAADMAGLVREVRERGHATVFAENIADSRLVERIASEADLPLGGTLYSDALSPEGGPAATYAQMMRHNVETIRAAALAD